VTAERRESRETTTHSPCDLDEVNRLQAWASTYFERSRDSFNPIHGLCFTGLATRLLLELTATEECFRKALKLAKRSGGSHSYTARLASSLLGEVLYDRGLLDDAERLLDEGYKLGPEQDPAKADLACRWAQEWVDRLVERHRPQALLRARRLVVACLAAAGRADEAKAVLATSASQCAQLGSVCYLPDGGPYVAATLTALHQDQQSRQWRPEWPEVPADFLARLVDAKVVHTI
jgi:hypothetical protein